jgi:BirA family biotin operon repressor/biotin-[acetyl-CoA-carboxylase] ligase
MSAPDRAILAMADTVLDECESTNDIAKKLAESGAPHGTWVSARKQGAGRGRLGRKWESVEGNLFLSIIVRMSPSERWSWVPMATAIAVAETLREFNPRFEVRIKWPNDLWIEGAKLGGILCEAIGTKTDSFIVIGLGLNCVRAPEGLDQRTVSLTEFLSRSGARVEVTADEIRQPFISAILNIIEELKREGSGPLLARYNKHAALGFGTPIEWVSSGHQHVGTVEGVGESGELLVRENGAQMKLYAEDVKVRPVLMR